CDLTDGEGDSGDPEQRQRDPAPGGREVAAGGGPEPAEEHGRTHPEGDRADGLRARGAETCDGDAAAHPLKGFGSGRGAGAGVASAGRSAASRCSRRRASARWSATSTALTCSSKSSAI